MGTLAELQASIGEIIGRSDQDSAMAQHLNAAQLHLALRYNMRGFYDTNSDTTTADQQTLDYPADYLRTVRMFMKDTVGGTGFLMKPIGRKKYYENYFYPLSASSKPKSFICDYEKWYLEPPAVVSLTLVTTIVVAPATIDANTASVLTNGDDALAWLASVYLMASLGEYDAASKKLGVALELIKYLSEGQQSALQTIDGYDGK